MLKDVFLSDIQEKQTTHYSHVDSDQHLGHCGLGPLVKSEPVEEHTPQADTGHDTGELTSNFEIEGTDDQLWHSDSHGVCGTDLVDPEISSTIEKCLQMFSQTDQYPSHSNITEMPCSFSSTAGKSLDEAFDPVAIKVEPETQPSACMGDVMLVSIQPGQGQCGNVAHTVASENLTLPALLQQPGVPQAERGTEGIPGPNTAYNPEHYVNRNRFRAKRMVNVWKNGLAQKMFLCSICGKGFPRFGQLEAHQLSHSGIKPYRCLECGKCFTQKKRLKTHQSVHTGERPFSCKICGKMFSRQDNCIRHERFHSGFKPHSCVQCGKHFTSLSNLRVHHQQVHT